MHFPDIVGGYEINFDTVRLDPLFSGLTVPKLGRGRVSIAINRGQINGQPWGEGQYRRVGAVGRGQGTGDRGQLQAPAGRGASEGLPGAGPHPRALPLHPYVYCQGQDAGVRGVRRAPAARSRIL